MSSIADLIAWRNASSGRRGFVPTMGALHDGHISLLRRARSECEQVVASIFVNPTQFGPGEDFATYPRDPEGDSEKVRQSGAADLIWFANAGEMYPERFETQVIVPSLSETLCGATRKGHFAGVAVVVLKLFELVRPHAAYFGRKDFQQLAIIRRMAADLNLPVEIIGCPTVREPDGLALSSRNLRLSPDGRRAAPVLHRALAAARARYGAGERSAAALLAAARAVLAEVPAVEVQYLELVDGETLRAVSTANAASVLAIAAFVDGVRLIDNVAMGEEKS